MSAGHQRALSEKQPPGPRRPFWLQVPGALKNTLGYLEELARYGPIVTVRPNRTYFVRDPDYVQHVLQENHPNYTKGPRYRRAVLPLFGDGLITSEGEFWRRQRRMIQPAFLRKHHDHFAKAIVRQTQATIESWRAAARAETPVNVRDEMMRLSLSALLRCVFSQEPDPELAGVGRAMLAVQNELNLADVFNPVRVPEFVPTPRRARLRRAYAVIDPFVARVVLARRKHGATDTDVASLLVFAQDEESGARMTAKHLRDEIVGIVAAGHDSITEGLTWAIFLLAQHPEVLERIRREAEAGPVRTESDATEGFAYTRMAVQEVMRVYPPIWGMMRVAAEPDVIGGYRIPAGAGVLVSQWVVHRDPDLWDEPQQFRPERFSPDRAASRHRFAYFPFGGGPRQCIGGSLAMLEMTLVVAMLARAFEFRLNDGPPVRPLPRVSLKPDRNIYMRVTERKA